MKKGIHIIGSLWKDPKEKTPNINGIVIDMMLYGAAPRWLRTGKAQELEDYIKQTMRANET